MERLRRVCGVLISVCAALVPEQRRDEWRREWIAEIEHEVKRMRHWNRSGRRFQLALMARSCGAALDAATLRWFQIEEFSMFQDLRYAARGLTKAPGFTAVVIITLAIGVGANTAIFSIVNTMLLRPIEYPAGDDLMIMRGTNLPRGVQRSNMSLPDIVDLRDQSETLLAAAAFDEESFNIAGATEPLRERGAYVTHGFFQVLGITPLLGRGFLPEEDRPGGPDVVVINETAWERHFERSADVLEQTLLIDGRPHQVVGVVANGTELPDFSNIWVPLGLDSTQGRGSHWLKAVARRQPGVSLEAAQAELDGLAAQLEREYAATNKGIGVRLYSLREARSDGFGQVAMLLMGFVGFLLLLACLNVANLLLSRATERQRELAVRSAMGAGRWQLTRQLLAESTLLAVVGGLVGLIAGEWALRLMIQLAPNQLPTWMVFELDGRVLFFTLSVLLFSLLMFGLAPSLKASAPDVSAMLKEGTRGASGLTGHRVRRALVVAQVAISLGLLVGAGLMVRSFLQLSAQDPGFSTEGVLTVRMELPRARYPDGAQRLAFYSRLLEETAALPGVESTGLIRYTPLRGGWSSNPVLAAGQTQEDVDNAPFTMINAVSDGYLQTAGLRLMAGRSFATDSVADAPPEVVVNDRLASHYWPGEDALGQQLSLDGGESWLTVVGVVDAVRHLALEDEAGLQLYLPFGLQPPGAATLFARTSGDPSDLVGPVLATMRSLDPQQPVYDILTTRQIVDAAIWDWRMVATLLWVFAVIALLLASVGIYGLVSFLVAQRTREVGIRIALGASRRSVYRMVFGQTGRMLGLGIVIGLACGAAVSQAMGSLLYNIGHFDPPTFIGVTLLLTLVAFAAVGLPARRAVRVDPLSALRTE